MSTDQLSSRPAPAARETNKLVRYDEYIDAQVENTRRMVKFVDLATSLVLLAAWVVVFLLVAAVVEHWLVPGGFPTLLRALLFAILTGSVCWFTYRRLLPLVMQRINPVYAAQSIETSAATGPSLKNTLVNLLLFRQHRAEISDAVYRTLEEQAAQRLSRVHVDSAVDRSLLIRFGYVLLGVVALASLYTVLSPKSPIVTAQRVLMPWADIVPPSRVQIQSIEPGSVVVSRGESVTVSANVLGTGEDDVVRVRYTTADGREVDKPVTMRSADNGLKFEARLPAADELGSAGLAQNLVYHIEAGDARSLDYTVTVVPAPSILVERVEYDYPDYTGYTDNAVEQLGDIRAIEGTRVTIHARANGPIKEAHIDFDADGRRDVSMTANETAAKAAFLLALRDDRQTPEHPSYVLRFSNEEGRTNNEPAKHSIAVDPDHAPEARILLPQEQVLDVQLHNTITIEVDARDPDFALAEVRLKGMAGGRSVIDQPLLPAGKHKHVTTRYQFAPSAHDLRAGDVVEYWLTASDNRTPNANVTESGRKQLRIVTPDPAQQPPQNQVAQNDRQQQRQPGEQQQQGKNDGGEQQQQPGGGGQDGQGQQPPQQSKQQDNQVSREAQPSGQDPQGEQSKDNQPNQENQQDEQQDNQPGAESGGGSGSESESKEQGESASPDGQQGSAGGASGENKPNEGQQNASEKQTGASGSGGDPSQQGAPPTGVRPDNAQSDSAQSKGAQQQPQNGSPQNQQQRQPNNSQQGEPQQAPVSSEGDNDAEAFERIQKHLEENGELKGEESAEKDGQQSDQPKPGDQQNVSRDAKQSAEEGQGDKETGRQGDSAANKSGKSQKQSQPQNAPNQPGKQADDEGEGPGAETKGDDLGKQQENPQGKQDQTKSPGGKQSASKGEAGAGEEKESQGSPDSQPDMKPGEKKQTSDSPDQNSDQTEPSSGAHGKKESDSKGEQGGDRAGGGEEGGGQDAPREGTGSAGQNQAADEGAGRSSEEGPGTSSSQPGNEERADKRNGQSGSEKKGPGSSQREGDGKKPGGAGGEDAPARGEGENSASPDGKDGQQKDVSRDAQRSAEDGQGDKETGRQGDEGKDAGKQGDDNAGEQSGDDGKSDGNSPSEQGGRPGGSSGGEGTGANPQNASEGSAPPGDEANLEYARKQTDLVLDKLAEQLNRKRVDDKMLKELGWSEEELRKFVERWQARKEAAKGIDPASENARRELDEALRSLGMQRGTLRQNQVKDDSLRDLKQGFRGPVPQEYRERLRIYNEGVSRSRTQDE